MEVWELGPFLASSRLGFTVLVDNACGDALIRDFVGFLSHGESVMRSAALEIMLLGPPSFFFSGNRSFRMLLVIPVAHSADASAIQYRMDVLEYLMLFLR